MPLRWRVLALLFAVRTTMAFQFQSVGALGPLVRADFGVGLADLGLLIGHHGQTIAAIQHLAYRIAFRGEEVRSRVVVAERERVAVVIAGRGNQDRPPASLRASPLRPPKCRRRRRRALRNVR